MRFVFILVELSMFIVCCVSAYNYFFGKFTELDKSIEGCVVVIGLFVITFVFLIYNLILKTM